MSSRRVILIVLLAALGLSAILGVYVVAADSERETFFVLWAAILTALASGLLLPLTLLTDRPKLRLTGYLAMAVVVMSWLCGEGLIGAESPGFGTGYELERALACSFLFTMLAGIPAVGVSLLLRFRWARFAVLAFLAAAGTGWLFGQLAALFAILLPHSYFPGARFYYEWEEYPFQSGFVFYGVGVCIAELLVNFRCGDRRYFRFPGIAAAAIAIILFLLMIWIPPFRGADTDSTDDFAKYGFVFLILALVLGHINLLLMARLRASQSLLQYAIIVITVLAGLAALPFPFLNYEYRSLQEILLRTALGLGLVAASGSIALIVLSMLNRKSPALLAPGALTATDITLVCPRCKTHQTLPFGDTICKSCELHISIKVVEPRCPACGYLLYRLTSQKCPECGAQIRESLTPPVATIHADT
jgi:hypothetical protein